MVVFRKIFKLFFVCFSMRKDLKSGLLSILSASAILGNCLLNSGCEKSNDKIVGAQFSKARLKDSSSLKSKPFSLASKVVCGAYKSIDPSLSICQIPVEILGTPYLFDFSKNEPGSGVNLEVHPYLMFGTSKPNPSVKLDLENSFGYLVFSRAVENVSRADSSIGISSSPTLITEKKLVKALISAISKEPLHGKRFSARDSQVYKVFNGLDKTIHTWGSYGLNIGSFYGHGFKNPIKFSLTEKAMQEGLCVAVVGNFNFYDTVSKKSEGVLGCMTFPRSPPTFMDALGVWKKLSDGSLINLEIENLTVYSLDGLRYSSESFRGAIYDSKNDLIYLSGKKDSHAIGRHSVGGSISLYFIGKKGAQKETLVRHNSR
jgi:hypothetical protein